MVAFCVGLLFGEYVLHKRTHTLVGPPAPPTTPVLTLLFQAASGVFFLRLPLPLPLQLLNSFVLDARLTDGTGHSAQTRPGLLALWLCTRAVCRYYSWQTVLLGITTIQGRYGKNEFSCRKHSPNRATEKVRYI